MTAMVKQTKKRDRFMISPPSAISKSSSSSPVTPPSPSAAGQEDEYESALSFLRDFRLKRVAACASSSDAFNDFRRMAPLYTIIESDAEGRGSLDEYELSDELSLAFNVVADDETCDDAASLPRMKKTAKTKCLLDLVDASSGESMSLASSLLCSCRSDGSIVPSHDYDFYFDLHDSRVNCSFGRDRKRQLDETMHDQYIGKNGGVLSGGEILEATLLLSSHVDVSTENIHCISMFDMHNVAIGTMGENEVIRPGDGFDAFLDFLRRPDR